MSSGLLLSSVVFAALLAAAPVGAQVQVTVSSRTYRVTGLAGAYGSNMARYRAQPWFTGSNAANKLNMEARVFAAAVQNPA